jgi:hypothetical protein
MSRRHIPWGWFSSRSKRNLSMGKRWGLPQRLISFGEWKEPFDGEKVGSLKRVVPLGKHYDKGR